MSILKALICVGAIATACLPAFAGEGAKESAQVEVAKATAPVAVSAPMPMPAVESKLEEYIPTVLIKGKWGNTPGEFGFGDGFNSEDVIPDEFICDDVGNIYIADKWNNRIQKFDARGKLMDVYPLGIFVRPSREEYRQSTKLWNKGLSPVFLKAEAKGLLWINGHLHIMQKKMPSLSTGKYVENVLVLKNGKFVPATQTAKASYRQKLKAQSFSKDNVNVTELVDHKKNRYALTDDRLEKFDSSGKKVFEFVTYRTHKIGTGGDTADFHSNVVLIPKAECFLELRKFAVGEEDPNHDWTLATMPDGGGMQVTKWCKK